VRKLTMTRQRKWVALPVEPVVTKFSQRPIVHIFAFSVRRGIISIVIQNKLGGKDMKTIFDNFIIIGTIIATILIIITLLVYVFKPIFTKRGFKLMCG